MRRCIPPVLLLLLLGSCSALPTPREMENMALLRTLGVDGDGGQISLTASTGLPSQSADGGQQKAAILSARGDSLEASANQLRERSDSCVFFAYVDQLLVGEGLARDGLLPLLDYVAHDREMSLGAMLWVVRGDTAQAGVESGGENGVEQRLNTLRLNRDSIRTANETCADLLDGGVARVPALVLEDGILCQRGFAILEQGRLIGYEEPAGEEGNP